MTTLTDTRTFTDRALACSADRVLHAARAMDWPHRLDEDLAVAWLGARGMFTNVAYVLAPPADWDDVLARVTQVVPGDVPVALIAASTTPDLTDRGWTLVGHPPLMIRPAGGEGPTVPAELSIATAQDDHGIEVFERTLVDGYPDPSLQPYRFGAMHDARVLGGGTHFYIGTVAGEPVATAAAHVAAGVNLVEMVATADASRGRGYGAALTWAATVADPSLPSVLIASDLGRGVYEDLGYHAVSRWTFWFRGSFG